MNIIKMTSTLLFALLFVYQCKGQANCLEDFNNSLKGISAEEVVDFNKVECIEWDSILIIAPAFSKEKIEQETDLSLPNEVDYSWGYDGEGSQWWVVFIKDKAVTGHFAIQRQDLDFSNFEAFKKGNKYGFFFLHKNNCKLITYYTGDKFSGSDEKVVDVKFLE